MKRFFIFILLIAVGASTAINALNELTLSNLTPGNRDFIRVADLRNLAWCGNYYVQVQGDSLNAFSPEQKRCITTTRAQLNEALAAAGHDTLASMPYFSIYTHNAMEVVFNTNHKIFNFNLLSRRIDAVELEADAERVEYFADARHVAYVKGQNVFVQVAPDDRRQITFETEEGIVCGTEVHQSEFGIHKGLFWSRDGNLLAFYRKDERMVEPYPVVDNSTRKAEPRPQRYPMAGMESHHVSVGVYNVNTGKTVWLATGEPLEKYLTNITFSPDCRSIYIEELNRGQDTCRLVRYSTATGEREKVLLEQTDTRYVEPQSSILFLPYDASRFVRQSEADGFNHLYLYNTDGKLLRRLTRGPWLVNGVLGFAGKELIFRATAQPSNLSAEGSPLAFRLFAVNVETGKMRCITPQEGVHGGSISANGRYIIDRYSAPDVPLCIDLLSTTNARTIKHLHTAPNCYDGYKMPTIKVGTILADDGTTTLYYRLVLPSDLDTTRSYPAVVYVYGGPHAQMITGGFNYGVRGWDIYMANRGYVMLTLDNRGSANRGHEFESIIHRNLGATEMSDQLRGVDLLKSLAYVDAQRIGVVGWSFGGFLTTNLMLTHGDIFKVGVAGGPVIDWSRYEIMYGERYMDTPQENPEGYTNANLALRAGDLKGRLLLIHGTMDPVVMWQHSLVFLKACIKAGTHPDYFVYPEHGHNVVGPDRVHLYEIITRYIDEHI